MAPTPPRLLYVPDTGIYTNLWVSETAGMGEYKLDKECDFYHDAFTGNLVEHVTIITSLLATSNIMVFLVVLARGPSLHGALDREIHMGDQ